MTAVARSAPSGAGATHPLANVAQRGLFAGLHATAPLELYARVVRGAADQSRERLVLAPGTRVTTETYFGRFPASYYQRWTTADRVDATLTVDGPARVTLRASDARGGARSLESIVTATGGPRQLRLSAGLDRFLDGGSLWVDVESLTGEVTVDGLEWSTPGHVGSGRPSAVVICTYNRAADCLETMRALSLDAVADLLSHVYVVDQGTDRVSDLPGYQEVAQALGRTLRYITQPNLGGAGGFTRGMLEVLDGDPEQTNALLMDDDIVLEPETVLRLTAFANRARQPLIAGGQMLYALHPTVLHKGAEWAHLRTFGRGPVEGALDEADLTAVLPHARLDAGYNGWWCCLLPAAVVRACGLPLPFFLQWDDTEYGVRAARRGIPTVTLPGAAVWHADFSWKDEDWTSYFGIRNGLITSAIHGELDGRSAVTTLGRTILTALVAMQYGLAATVLEGVEGFLAGPAIIGDGGATAAAAVRRLRQMYPDTVHHPVEAIPTPPEGHVASLPQGYRDPDRPLQVLAGRLAAQLRGRTSGRAVIRADQAPWWHVAGFAQAVVSERSQDGVRIRTYDRDTFLALSRRAARLLTRLHREAPELQRRWQEAAPELVTQQTWRRLLGMPAQASAGGEDAR